MNISSQTLRHTAMVAVALFLLGQLAFACDTPVYRYAMYRWDPAPYEVYFFHDQPPAETDQRIGRLVESLISDPKRPANIFYFDVNLASDPEMARISPRIKAAYLAHEDRQLPSYLIATPFGVEIFFGKLDEPAFQTLVESPARSDLAAQLAAGKAGVFLFIPSSDAEASANAEAVVKGLIEEVKAGDIPLYTSPGLPLPGAEGAPAPPTIELGIVKVTRDDPQEQWLVRSLFAMEAELKDEDLPMTFLVYGRGRALLPYLGAGITRENLLYEIEFITGACSCTVKEQNPGADLLVRQNWQEAAMKLAEMFSGEEGNPYGPGMFFPELVIPSGSAPSEQLASASDETRASTAAADVTATEAATSAAGDSGQAASDQPAATPATETTDSATTVANSTAAEPAAEATAAAPEALAKAPSAADVAVADAHPAMSNGSHAVEMPASPYWSLFAVGGAVLVSLVVLFALTFAVLRPR